MRILFYAHSSTLYGANRSLIDLILGLKINNPSIDLLVIIPAEQPLGDELKRNAINFKTIPHYNWFYNKEVADNWKIKSSLLFQLWFLKNKFSKSLKNKFFFKEHIAAAKKFSPDLIYVNSSLNPMGLMVAKNLNIKCVWHHRETVNEAIYGYYLEDTKKFNSYFEKSDLHIFTSRFLLKQYDSFKNRSKKVFFNGVVPAARRFNGTFNPEKIRFGIVGRINNQKGQKEVIELFKSPIFLNNSSIELHIIGSGDSEFLNWFKTIQSKNIYHYEFLDRYDIYNKFDVLISNASNEAFGRTIAEANYNGIPVLARNSGAFPELIINGKNGFIFEDLEDLSKYIQLLSNFSNLQFQELSEYSYMHAKENFDYVKIAHSLLKEIKRI